MASVKISVEGIDRALRVLQNTAENIHEDMWEVLQQIGDVVEQEADENYATWGGDDGNTVTVWQEPNPNERELTVIATGIDMYTPDELPAGNTVVVEEFGAGWGAEGHPLAVEYGVYPGQWSNVWGQKQWERNPEFWVHKVAEKVYHRFTEIPATQAMYKAGEKAKREARTIVREVFIFR